jgi:hypothetical protein
MVGLTKRELIEQLDRSSRVITETAAFTFDHRVHGGRITLLSLLAGFTATLPAAIGSGVVFEVIVGIVRTSNSYIINCLPTTDNFEGNATVLDTDTSNILEGFPTTGNDDNRITLNATTTGGLTIGDWLVLRDVAATVWHVHGQLTGSSDLATPFSNV